MAMGSALPRRCTEKSASCLCHLPEHCILGKFRGLQIWYLPRRLLEPLEVLQGLCSNMRETFHRQQLSLRLLQEGQRIRLAFAPSSCLVLFVCACGKLRGKSSKRACCDLCATIIQPEFVHYNPCKIRIIAIIQNKSIRNNPYGCSRRSKPDQRRSSDAPWTYRI